MLTFIYISIAFETSRLFFLFRIFHGVKLYNVGVRDFKSSEESKSVTTTQYTQPTYICSFHFSIYVDRYMVGV